MRVHTPQSPPLITSENSESLVEGHTESLGLDWVSGTLQWSQCQIKESSGVPGTVVVVLHVDWKSKVGRTLFKGP